MFGHFASPAPDSSTHKHNFVKMVCVRVISRFASYTRALPLLRVTNISTVQARFASGIYTFYLIRRFCNMLSTTK